MRAQNESSADRLWREKLESCASPRETVAVLLVMAVLVVSMLVG